MSIFCSKELKAPVSSCNPKSGGICEITLHNYVPAEGAAFGVKDEITVECIPETSHLESVYSFNNDTRTGSWTNTLFIDLGEISTTNRSSIESLTSSYFACKAKFIDGTTAYFGKSTDTAQSWPSPAGHPYPCHATAGNLNSGTKMEDKQGYDLTIVVKSLVSPEIVAAPTD